MYSQFMMYGQKNIKFSVYLLSNFHVVWTLPPCVDILLGGCTNVTLLRKGSMARLNWGTLPYTVNVRYINPLRNWRKTGIE